MADPLDLFGNKRFVPFVPQMPDPMRQPAPVQAQAAPAKSAEANPLQKLGAAALDLGGITSFPSQVLAGFAGAPYAVSSTPAYDAVVRQGDRQQVEPGLGQKLGAAAADILMTPVRGAQALGNYLDPVEVSPVRSYTPAYDVVRQLQSRNPAATEAAPNAANAANANKQAGVTSSADDNVGLSFARPSAEQMKYQQRAESLQKRASDLRDLQSLASKAGMTREQFSSMASQYLAPQKPQGYKEAAGNLYLGMLARQLQEAPDKKTQQARTEEMLKALLMPAGNLLVSQERPD